MTTNPKGQPDRDKKLVNLHLPVDMVSSKFKYTSWEEEFIDKFCYSNSKGIRIHTEWYVAREIKAFIHSQILKSNKELIGRLRTELQGVAKVKADILGQEFAPLHPESIDKFLSEPEERLG